MKLLICTQVIDKNDPALGFFVSWVREFAKQFERITVVCLYRGKYELPDNVRVFSLGKEQDSQHIHFDNRIIKRFRYMLRFKRLVWRYRRDYDAVFVHMNAEYAVMGGLLWRLLRKRVALWYNHPARHWKVRFAAQLAHRLFYTSTQSFTAQYAHSRQMPVGIDVSVFSRQRGKERSVRSILSLGRISNHKRIHVLVDGLKLLRDRHISFNASIYGNAPESERSYGEAMRTRAAALEGERLVHWYKAIPHEKTPELFNTYGIFVNLSVPGMFDKTILEAMACEMVVLTSNPVLKNRVPDACLFEDGNALDFANKAAILLDLPEGEREAIGKRLREYVEREHTLKTLARRLGEEMGAL
jgi:glycosyltransferase involved in cell wall biosynthesis